MAPRLLLACLLAGLCAPLRAQPQNDEDANELFLRGMDEAMDRQGIQRDVPTPTASATWGREERCFPRFLTSDPSIAKAPGVWTLINEVKDGRKEYVPGGLKTETGLERTLDLSATGSPGGGSFTALPLGTNIDGTNVNDPREDHVGSWEREFTVNGGYLKFRFIERYPDDAPDSPGEKLCVYGYWCRNYLFATHLVCQVEKDCVRRDGAPTGTRFICQDFTRRKTAPAAPRSDSTLDVPAVPETPDGALLPGLDLKAPPAPVP